VEGILPDSVGVEIWQNRKAFPGDVLSRSAIREVAELRTHY